MATRQQIVTALLAGKSARQIMDELHIPPSKLRRALVGKRLKEALALERDVAGAGRDFRTAEMASAAVGQLGALTSAGNAESARRACMTILDAAAGGQRPGGMPMGGAVANSAPTAVATRPGGVAAANGAVTAPGVSESDALLALLALAGSSGQ